MTEPVGAEVRITALEECPDMAPDDGSLVAVTGPVEVEIEDCPDMAPE